MQYTLKKSLGQHFLKDESICKKIVDVVDANLANHAVHQLVEVGPGGGAITKYLLQLPNINFKAVELDAEKVAFLEATYPAIQQKIIHENFLDIQAPFENQFIVVGNFPYNISSQIVIKMLDNTNQIPIMLGMFQKEMAKRILAVPGSKDYGIISVLTSLRYHGKILFDIGPNNFSPPPRVISSFLILHRNSKSISDDLFNKTKTLVKIAFHSRRKTLRNNLKTIISDPSILEDAFFDQRAENLLPQDYLVLVEQIKPYLNSSLILE